MLNLSVNIYKHSFLISTKFDGLWDWVGCKIYEIIKLNRTKQTDDVKTVSEIYF